MAPDRPGHRVARQTSEGRRDAACESRHDHHGNERQEDELTKTGGRQAVRRRVLAAALGCTVLGGFLAVTPAASAATQIVGAGSTFDFPFFSKAFYDYTDKHPDVTVNYQSIGSGG